MREVLLPQEMVHTGDLILVNDQFPFRKTGTDRFLLPAGFGGSHVLLDGRVARLLEKLVLDLGGGEALCPVSGWRSREEQEAIYALMNVFNALLSMLINLTGGYGSALVTLRARKLLWRKILHLPMREVERRQPSALISGLVNDITQASLVVQMAFNTIVSLYSFFRCCWEMYRFDGTLSLYMLLLLPIAVLVFALVGHLQ